MELGEFGLLAFETGQDLAHHLLLLRDVLVETTLDAALDRLLLDSAGPAGAVD
jgi:hypothetical protein